MVHLTNISTLHPEEAEHLSTNLFDLSCIPCSETGFMTFEFA